MLTLIDHLSGRPWAVRPEAAEYLRGLLLKDGVAGLRDLVALRSVLMVEDNDAPAPRAGSVIAARNGATVAVIPVIGPLTQRGGIDMATCQGFRSTDAIAEEIRAATAEPKIDAIVLEVDSPGGEVYGVPEAWLTIRESAKVKPIVAAVNSISASAAYYLSSAASEIWLNPSGQVGSIGVYCLHIDVSKALKDSGQTWTFVSAGRYKLEANPIEPLSDEARFALQSQVDSYYGDFVRDVARGRDINTKLVTNGFGEGRMVRATQALEQRMIDHIGTIQDAIRRAAVLGRERRKNAPAATTPAAGINDVPNLAEGTTDRACATCGYYRKPAPAASSGACTLYDFTSQDMWVCDAWEAKEEDLETESDTTPPPPLPPSTPEPVPVASTNDQRIARAVLRIL
jgi:capsid assembly protease